MASKRESECLEILIRKFGHGKLWRGSTARLGKQGWYFTKQSRYQYPIYISARLSKKACEDANEDAC